MQSTLLYLLPDSNHCAILSLINDQLTSDQQTTENAIKAPLLLCTLCTNYITITITMRYLYSASYRIGQRR